MSLQALPNQSTFILNYAQDNRRPRYLLNCILSSIAFATGHLLTEYPTGYFVLFKLHPLDPVLNGYALAKLQDRFFTDMIIETVWVLIAATMILIIQLALRPALSTHARKSVPLLAVAAGIGYSWLRWGIYGLTHLFSIKFPEPINFLIAMALAGFVGIQLARYREKSTD